MNTDMNADVAGWAVTGLCTSVVAPALVLTTARHTGDRILSVPAGWALPGFVILHAGLTLALAHRPSTTVWLLLHLPLLVGALIFWLPVFGPTRRLSDPLRVMYLFLSAPPLDLAGVIVIVQGDPAGGLAMIVGMLPAGVTAVLVTWQWIHHEEHTLTPRHRGVQ
jgi:cytochrome c oxidase assembly factor CtaG